MRLLTRYVARGDQSPRDTAPPLDHAAQRIFDLSLDLLCIAELHGRVRRINPAVERTLGWTLDELLVLPWQDLVHPDDRNQVQQTLASIEAPDGPRMNSVPCRFRCRDGSYRSIAWHASAPDQDGLVYAVGRDVTETHHAQAALLASEAMLRASEERLRVVYERAAVGIAVADASGRYEEANPAFCAMLGYSEAELVGREIDELTVSEDRTEQTDRLDRLRAGTARVYSLEKRYIRKDGGTMWACVTASVIDGVSGADRRYIAVVEDITERKRAEQALRDSEAQLQQAVKMEAVGRLAGGIAHDFNNLLTVILGYGTFMDGDLPPESRARSDLHEILAAGRRAAELTRQLLAFGRKQILQPRLVNVNETVGGVVVMLRRLIGEDVALTTELADAPSCVLADPGQLVQVLMNLSVNARDAMPNGGTLRLRTKSVTVDGASVPRCRGLVSGDYVSIEVEDTGTGIAPAVLPHIFEPFFTTKAPGSGTGLGLATVYGIVKQSGGFIYADSTPGVGTRFTLLLPRSECDAPPDAATTGEPLLGGSETILLVEDEPATRATIKRMLQRLGYTVHDACDAVDALARLQTLAPRVKLVLTDVVMPGQNGRELGEQIAARWPSLPVLYMSGYMDDEILRRGLIEANTGLLQKPVTPERLASAVRKAVEAS